MNMKIPPSLVLLIILLSAACSFKLFGKAVEKSDKIKEKVKDVKQNKIQNAFNEVIDKKFHKFGHKNESHGFVPSQVKCKSRHPLDDGAPLTRSFVIFFSFVAVTSFQKCDPCPKGVKCVPAIQCPAHLKMSKSPQMCDLPGAGSTHGLCCTTKQSHVAKDFSKTHGKFRSKNANLVKDSLRNAKMEFKMMMHKERNHKAMGRARDFGPDHFHQMVFG